MHVQGSKIVGKMDQFGEKSKIKLNSAEFIEFIFSKSAYKLSTNNMAANRDFLLQSALKVDKSWHQFNDLTYLKQTQFDLRPDEALFCCYQRWKVQTS